MMAFSLPPRWLRAPLVLVASFFSAALLVAAEPLSERQYLSGRGPADAVPWSFTVSAGRRAGESTTIPVPSQWELQGFGTYNYGQEVVKSSERGHYQTKFSVPATWKSKRVRLVFDGVMTDTAVKVNGASAGPIHQGGFMQFRYDVTSLLKFGDGAAGENLLEVDVAKVSADAKTELAERGGDYWVFGGIYRPVWLEAVPTESIEHLAIDARADGAFTVDVTLGAITNYRNRPDGPKLEPERVEVQIMDAKGQNVGAAVTAKIPGGGVGRLRLAGRIESPKLWTAETPALYSMRVSRLRGTETVHVLNQRFGFRTFEVRDSEGLFLNGKRILLKGVNRHSFRPETGRALTREDCYADARMIRSMNMNAVRMSHYPPDEAFLEACDELGLYVLDEMSGWQHEHGTPIGRLLVREMVERDVNHPSILFWDNGNEGGFNRDLDGDYSLYDPQQRRVLHPWNPFSGVDTKHYTAFDEHLRLLRGPNLVMPTEILHALYDGGAGAGLEDYWHAVEKSPFGAGMFIWDFADEGVVRTDEGNRIDPFSTFGPDGIVGPHFEKEGSYYAVRDIWSPIQIQTPTLDEKFDGKLSLQNRYDFVSLSGCTFTWKLEQFDRKGTLSQEGTVGGPAIAAGATGILNVPLPKQWREADALSLTALDAHGVAVWTWAWPIPAVAERKAMVAGDGKTKPATLEKSAASLRLAGGAVTAEFDPATGLLRKITRAGKAFALTNGPRLTFARPEVAGDISWLNATEAADSAAVERRLATPQLASTVEIELNVPKGTAYAAMKIELSADGDHWKTVFNASRRPGDGSRYDFPPQKVAAVRVSQLRTIEGQPATFKSFRLGYAPSRFADTGTEAPQISSGNSDDGKMAAGNAWIEIKRGAHETYRWSMTSGGELHLDYRYDLSGDFIYHGITFDLPEEQMMGLRWVGAGPNRIWQNRLRGTWFGQHEVLKHELQPGSSFSYPEFEGIYAGVNSAELATVAGTIAMRSTGAGSYLRVATPRISHPFTTVDFPSGDVSWLHAVPAMGSKFKKPAQSGPSGQPARASGTYSGTLNFDFRP